MNPMEDIRPDDHQGYLKLALSLARKSPPKPSNFRVGALLVDTKSNKVLATGCTLELEGNTHAEQCCFMKLAAEHDVPEEQLGDALATGESPSLALYTTMEPCSKRLSGNLPCVERVLRLRGVIRAVYVGVLEPQTFVADNTGRAALEAAGIEVVHVQGMEQEILQVATAGHTKQET